MMVYAITDTKRGRTGIAPTYLQTTRISVVRDVADRFWGWQQLMNYRDPENKSGALGGDIKSFWNMLNYDYNVSLSHFCPISR